jgi:hypothetical protein
MTAMDAVAASVGLTRAAHPESHHSSFGTIPGRLQYTTVDGSSPGQLNLGWGATAQPGQPSDFADTEPTDPLVVFYQAGRANVASWWPAAAASYRYILEIRASWAYYSSPQRDPIPSPTSSVRPS